MATMSLFAFQSGATATGNGTPLSCANVYRGVTIQVEGIGTATVDFEITADGSNYHPLQVLYMETGEGVTETDADGVFAAPALVRQASYLRCPISAYTSGTITVSARYD